MAPTGEKSEQDLERERQKEADKARLREELRQLREKEEKEAQEKAAREEAEAQMKKAEEQQRASQEASSDFAPPSSPSSSAPREAPASSASVTRQMASVAVADPEPFSTTVASSDIGASPGTIRLRAIADHDATSPDELSYQKGDIITALAGTDTKAASCKAVLKGHAGLVSLANTEDPTTGKRNGPPQVRRGVRCRAIGNYTAKAADELSFKQGDVIFVTVLTPDPIWTGVSKGQVGKFPRRLVVDDSGDLDSFPAPAPTAAVSIAKYVCVKPYTAKGPDELNITFGDVIQVANNTDDEILVGACNGSHGRFPVEHAVNATEYTKQQIAQMIELEKKKAPKGGWVTFDAAPAPAFASPLAADPFLPQPLSSSRGGAGDPFAVSSDPFAPQPPSLPRAGDPFAPQPAFGSSPTSPMSGFGAHVPMAAPHHHPSPLSLPLVSAAAVQRALAESGPVALTPPSPPRTRTHTGSRREQSHLHSGQASSAGSSTTGSGRGSLTMIHATPGHPDDSNVSGPLGPTTSN